MFSLCFEITVLVVETNFKSLVFFSFCSSAQSYYCSWLYLKLLQELLVSRKTPLFRCASAWMQVLLSRLKHRIDSFPLSNWFYLHLYVVSRPASLRECEVHLYEEIAFANTRIVFEASLLETLQHSKNSIIRTEIRNDY